MSERFNVVGALLVKIFGRSQAMKADVFRARTGLKVRDIGVTTAISTVAIFFTALILTASLATAIVLWLSAASWSSTAP